MGVTGGIGSGKTLVCNVFGRLGIPVYDADSRAKWLMDHRESLKEKIAGLLGEGAYRAGKLDREYVARRVFSDGELLERLNRVVHPEVRDHYAEWVTKQADAPYVIEEAAILFESGADRFMDMTVLVYAPEQLRLARVMERDGVEEKEVRQRMSRQMSEEKKKELADAVIFNDEKAMLLPQIITLHQRILNIK